MLEFAKNMQKCNTVSDVLASSQQIVSCNARRGYSVCIVIATITTSVGGTNIEIHNNGLPGEGEIYNFCLDVGNFHLSSGNFVG